MSKAKIYKAANGHLMIEFGEYDSSQWFLAVNILQNELNFTREGQAVMGMDEGIMPSFVKGDITIDAGWDNWSGNYLLSESFEGDELLKVIFENLQQI